MLANKLGKMQYLWIEISICVAILLLIGYLTYLLMNYKPLDTSVSVIEHSNTIHSNTLSSPIVPTNIPLNASTPETVDPSLTEAAPTPAQIQKPLMLTATPRTVDPLLTKTALTPAQIQTSPILTTTLDSLLTSTIPTAMPRAPDVIASTTTAEALDVTTLQPLSTTTTGALDAAIVTPKVLYSV